MTSRKQRFLIEPTALFGLLAMLAAFWLVGLFSQDLPHGAGLAIGLVVLLGVGGGIVYPAIARPIRRANARRALLERVKQATDQELAALVSRRARLGGLGRPQTQHWAIEIDQFIRQSIQPVLPHQEQAALARDYAVVAGMVGERVETALRDRPPSHIFRDDMTTAEFTAFCAEELRCAGWNIRATRPRRGDGADLVAERNGRRVAVQCKRDASSVGYRSVQEASAARSQERADFGILVSSTWFTAAAEHLASTNNILLLHYRDLQALGGILDRQRQPVSAAPG